MLGMLVIVKREATPSILDKPQGNHIVQIINIFNLFFLLVVNPLAAILLIARCMTSVDPTHVTIDTPWILIILEIAGMLIYATGFLLMAGALITLGRHYQPGGIAPRSEDKVIMRVVRMFFLPTAMLMA